jgi:hypothetical protein
MCKWKAAYSRTAFELKVDGVDAAPDVIRTDQIGSGFTAPTKNGPELFPLDAIEVITCGGKRDRLASVDVVGQDLLGHLLDLVELLEVLDP